MKKNKPSRKLRELHHASRRRQPGPPSTQVSWTPLKQTCGCVVDWGWTSQTADPVSFKDWFISRLTVPCLWHSPSEAGASGDDLPDNMIVRPRGSNVLLHVRKASGDHLELGAQLASRLERVLDKARQGDAVLLDDAPAGFRNWLIKTTLHPAQAWLDHELTDIILNQGRSALPREILEQLPDQLLDSPCAQPESGACDI
nr:hypothetical protein [Streptomyces antimycoticus]